MRFLSQVSAAAVAGASLASALTLNNDDPSSIKSVASTIAYDMLQYYPGNQSGQTPGLLVAPYYWWEAGAMFGTLIDYWYYTGDSTYNDLVSQGLLFQAGTDYDYMPQNQTQDEGNDDQIFWGFSVMSAAEYNFPNPPADSPGWLALAEAVFNTQSRRWDNATCGGGLRWQIFFWNNGYNYKNSPSNGGMMNLAARLYAYTGNQTYSDWVYKTWDWLSSAGLISQNYNVYDGVEIEGTTCGDMDQIQWSYSLGMLLNTAAIMQNLTAVNETANSTMWTTRANGLWTTASSIFYNGSVMFESACEPRMNCDPDQLSFKAYYTRFLLASTKWMPTLWPQIQSKFLASATAAAAQCDGGASNTQCGFQWPLQAAYDGSTGPGQQMDALEIVMTNLITAAPYPVTAIKGGTSKGNVSLGTQGDDTDPALVALPTITTGDRAGAGILTAVVLAGSMGGVWWLVA